MEFTQQAVLKNLPFRQHGQLQTNVLVNKDGVGLPKQPAEETFCETSGGTGSTKEKIFAGRTQVALQTTLEAFWEPAFKLKAASPQQLNPPFRSSASKNFLFLRPKAPSQGRPTISTNTEFVEGIREFVRFFQEFTGLAATGRLLGSCPRDTSLQRPRQSVALQFPDNLNLFRKTAFSCFLQSNGCSVLFCPHPKCRASSLKRQNSFDRFGRAVGLFGLNGRK